MLINGVNKNQWEWKIQVQAREYSLFLLYFIFRCLLIREYSLNGWLLFNVTRLVSQLFQCYLFLYHYSTCSWYYNFLCRSCDLQNGVSEWSLLNVKWTIFQLYHGVKSLIHQSELRRYTKIVPFQEKKFLSLSSIVKTTEWNGLIKIDNWS